MFSNTECKSTSVKVGAGEEQAVDNPLYNDMIRSYSLEVDEHAPSIRVLL
jgi:hypothetical protein